MNCQVLSTLYIKANGDVLCECDVGENITLGVVEAEGDWSIGDLITNEKYAHIRRAFLRDMVPWERYCPYCAFLRSEEPLCDRLADKHMVKAQFELSLRCALACPCCSRQRQIKERPKPHIMDPKLFDHLLVSAVKEGYAIDFIEYCGQGEPLSHPQFQTFVSMARSRFPYTKQRLVTNGNYDYHSAIGDEFLDEIYVSCDGADQKSYEKYRRNGSIDTVMRFMEDAKRREGKKPQVVWKYILFEFNDSDEQIIAAQKRAMDIGVDSIAFIRTHTRYRSTRFDVEGADAIPVIAPITIVDATPIYDNKEVAGEPAGVNDSRLGPILRHTICVFDEVRLMGGMYITIRGWAMGKNGEHVKDLRICCDHDQIGSATCGLPRPDVAQHYQGDAALHSGFFFTTRLPHSIQEAATLTAHLELEGNLTDDFEVPYRFDRPHLSHARSSNALKPIGSDEYGIIRQLRGVNCVIDSVRLIGDSLLSVTGWASDKRGIELREIRISVNQIHVGNATLGLSRADFEWQDPGHDASRLGFYFLGNVPQKSSQIMSISFELITKKNQRREFEDIFRLER